MASDSHHDADCPHAPARHDAVMISDLDKQNHFCHDTLGCPYECEGDHNHPQIGGD